MDLSASTHYLTSQTFTVLIMPNLKGHEDFYTVINHVEANRYLKCEDMTVQICDTNTVSTAVTCPPIEGVSYEAQTLSGAPTRG